MRRIIKAVRRPKKFIRRDKNNAVVYDVCLVERSSHRNKVFEKLGTFSIRAGVLTLNSARLV